MNYLFITAFVLAQFTLSLEARAEKKFRRDLASIQPVIKGTIEGAKRQDYGAPEVVGMAIRGELAKQLYQHLKIKTETLSSVDGPFQVKFGQGVQCNLISRTGEYECFIDVGAKGI